MPDLVEIDTRTEAALLEVDRRLYLQDATITFLRPVAPSGLQATRTVETHWFVDDSTSTSEDDILILKVPDLDGTLEEDLVDISHVEMLGVKYEKQKIDRPKPGQARIYYITTSVKKFAKKNFRLPT